MCWTNMLLGCVITICATVTLVLIAHIICKCVCCYKKRKLDYDRSVEIAKTLVPTKVTIDQEVYKIEYGKNGVKLSK